MLNAKETSNEWRPADVGGPVAPAPALGARRLGRRYKSVHGDAEPALAAVPERALGAMSGIHGDDNAKKKISGSRAAQKVGTNESNSHEGSDVAPFQDLPLRFKLRQTARGRSGTEGQRAGISEAPHEEPTARNDHSASTSGDEYGDLDITPAEADALEEAAWKAQSNNAERAGGTSNSTRLGASVQNQPSGNLPIEGLRNDRYTDKWQAARGGSAAASKKAEISEAPHEEPTARNDHSASSSGDEYGDLDIAPAEADALEEAAWKAQSNNAERAGGTSNSTRLGASVQNQPSGNLKPIEGLRNDRYTDKWQAARGRTAGVSKKADVSEATQEERNTPGEEAVVYALPNMLNQPSSGPPQAIKSRRLGTYGNRGKERERLGIGPAGNFEAEHIVPFAALYPGIDRNGSLGKTLEKKMPAYLEVKEHHRKHPATGDTGKDRVQAGWSTGDTCRKHVGIMLSDPVARVDGTSLSNAYQMNQLGYAFVYAELGRQSNNPLVATDQMRVATASYNNTVKLNPALKLPDSWGGETLRLDPEGQAEAILAHEIATTGEWPSQERRLLVYGHFLDLYIADIKRRSVVPQTLPSVRNDALNSSGEPRSAVENRQSRTATPRQTYDERAPNRLGLSR